MPGRSSSGRLNRGVSSVGSVATCRPRPRTVERQSANSPLPESKLMSSNALARTASRWLAAAAVIALFPVQALYAQSSPSADLDRIRAEGTQRSQVMDIASWLTDVHGPRLTNSPQAHAAGEYAREKMASWGLASVGYEWFPFGRGWANERAVAQVVEPVPYPVTIIPGAWTAGTDGPVTAEVVAVTLSAEASDADYAQWSGKLRGKVVLDGTPPNVTPLWDAPGSRMTDEALDRMSAAAIVPAAPRPGAAAPQANEARMA